MTRGSVISLHRFPVKSMAGESLAALDVGEHGAAGDREHALWQRGGRKLTAKSAPRMLAWHASLNGGLVVTSPDGREFAWDEELEAALAEDLGKDVELVSDPRGMPDAAGLHITFEASRRLLEEELGITVDVRRFRPNIHVDSDLAPFEESRWEDGQRLRVGDAELEIVGRTDRCSITIHDPETIEPHPDLLRTINERHDTLFGVWADARGAARIAVGDPLELL